MTDTPKPTLAEKLRDKAYTYNFLSNQTAVLRQANGPQVSAEFVAMAHATTECAELAEQHESRWSAEFAELQLRSLVLRNTVEELRAEIEDHEKENAKLVAELEAFRALAREARLRELGWGEMSGDEILNRLAARAEEPKP